MINIVVALHAEAKPLIDYYKLKKTNERLHFPIYTADQVRLIISNIGMVNAANAVVYLAGYQRNNEQCAWLNVGIAGHASRNIGEVVIAHKIVNTQNAACFYPHLLTQFDAASVEVQSVDQPQLHYIHLNCAYDMEAAGFFAGAQRFSTVELIQVVKVISDNAQNPADMLDKTGVTELIRSQLPLIDKAVNALQDIQNTLITPPEILRDYEALVNQFHFTVTQQHKLMKLLKCCYAISPGFKIDSVSTCASAAEVLGVLEGWMNSQAVKFE